MTAVDQLLENKNAVIYGASGDSAAASPGPSRGRAPGSSSPDAPGSRSRRSLGRSEPQGARPRSPWSTPSTNGRSTSTLGASSQRRATSCGTWRPRSDRTASASSACTRPGSRDAVAGEDRLGQHGHADGYCRPRTHERGDGPDDDVAPATCADAVRGRSCVPGLGPGRRHDRDDRQRDLRAGSRLARIRADADHRSATLIRSPLATASNTDRK